MPAGKESRLPDANVREAVRDYAPSPTGATAGDARADWRDPRYQAFVLMRLAFTVAPIAFGLDKFLNVMVDWPTYLAPWINDIAPGTGQEFMYFVGATEILAGIIVALKPRYGAYVVAGWLAMLGALTLARIASVYDPPLALGRG